MCEGLAMRGSTVAQKGGRGSVMRGWAEAALLSHVKKSGLTLRAVGSQGTTWNSLSLPLPDLTDLVFASRGSQAGVEEASAKCQDKGLWEARGQVLTQARVVREVFLEKVTLAKGSER